MQIGDIVVRKSYGKDITFKIIDIKEIGSKENLILKGINIRIIADSSEEDLELANDGECGSKDKILNTRVNEAIKNAYDILDKVNFSGKYCRLDIGK